MKLEHRVYDETRDGSVKHFAGRLTGKFMAFPLDEDHTEFIDCVGLAFGVEYRYVESSEGFDEGVSIHVCDGTSHVEYLRFDCFEDRAHYHYMYVADGYHERFFIDAVSDGDPVMWSLERLRTRLPAMLERVGARHLLSDVEPKVLEAAVFEVALLTYRAIDSAVSRRPTSAAGTE